MELLMFIDQFHRPSLGWLILCGIGEAWSSVDDNKNSKFQISDSKWKFMYRNFEYGT